MANRVPIKPGCLCLVLSGAKEVHGVVESGDIVEAVEYKGTTRSLKGSIVLRVWKITNARIEADVAKTPGQWIGCSADNLQPISDPDTALDISLETETPNLLWTAAPH